MASGRELNRAKQRSHHAGSAKASNKCEVLQLYQTVMQAITAEVQAKFGNDCQRRVTTLAEARAEQISKHHQWLLGEAEKTIFPLAEETLALLHPNLDRFIGHAVAVRHDIAASLALQADWKSEVRT
jgi:hypothetical protein